MESQLQNARLVCRRLVERGLAVVRRVAEGRRVRPVVGVIEDVGRTRGPLELRLRTQTTVLRPMMFVLFLTMSAEGRVPVLNATCRNTFAGSRYQSARGRAFVLGSRLRARTGSYL